MKEIILVSNDNKVFVRYLDISDARMIAEMFGGVVYILHVTGYVESVSGLVAGSVFCVLEGMV